MGLFGGRRTFGETQWREVAALVQQELRARGLETVLDDGALRGADSRVFGLDGIAFLAARTPRSSRRSTSAPSPTRT